MSGTNGAAAPGTGDGEGTEGGDDAAAREALETRARNMGWQPRSRYRGDPELFVDAAEFIEKGERLLPILQQTNRRHEQTITGLQRQLAEQSTTLSNLVKSTRKAEKLGYERARRELEQQRAKAVAEGDTAAFNEAEREIKALGPEPVEEPPAPARPNGGTPEMAPEVQDFVRRNPWFRTNVSAQAFATAELSQVEAESPGETLAEHLVEVEARVRQRFPELFPARRRARQPEPDDEGDGADDTPPPRNTRQQRAPMVTPSNSAPARRPGPRSFDALPAEAKREYERQAKMITKGEPFTKEEYARYYWESEGEAA